jgi:hypothetical protein
MQVNVIRFMAEILLNVFEQKPENRISIPWQWRIKLYNEQRYQPESRWSRQKNLNA